jgi:hypothetical protein
LLPPLRVGFTVQDDEMAMQGIAQDLGAVDAKGIGPKLNRSCILVMHPEAEHRHTINDIAV